MEPAFLAMQSECLDSKGKAYPSFQDHNTIPPLISTQNCNGNPNTENGMQKMDEASHYYKKWGIDDPFHPPNQQEKAGSKENAEIVLTHRSHMQQTPSEITAGSKSSLQVPSSQKCTFSNTNSSLCGPQMPFPQPSACGVLPTGEVEPPTDNQILKMIADKLALFRARKNIVCGATPTREAASNNRDASSSQTVAEQLIAATGNATNVNGNQRKTEAMNPKAKESASKNFSSEHHQIVMEAPTTPLRPHGNSSQNNNKPTHFHDSAYDVMQNFKPLLEKGSNSVAQVLKDPQYDDVSDDDNDSKEATGVSQREQKNRSPIYCENPQYEDISDDENHPPIPKTSEPKLKMSLLKNEDAEEGERRSTLPTTTEEQFQLCVTPLPISSHRYEASKEGHDIALANKDPSKGSQVQSKQEPSSESLSALAASVLDVHDSFKTHQETNSVSQIQPGLPELEDSSETEDSCDYTPAPERNYMTVPKHWLKINAPLCSEDDDSENENEHRHKRRKTTRLERVQKVAAFMNTQPAQNDKLFSNKIQIFHSPENNNSVELINENTNTNGPLSLESIVILDSDTE